MRTLLWLIFVGGVVLQVCGADVIEGPDKKPKRGCVTGPPKDCGIGGHNLKCRQILKEPEDGGEACPPEIEPEDPTKPENLGQQCYVGPWSNCGPLPGYPSIMVRTREPTDLTADLTTCPPLIELCPGTGPQDCIMTEWSPWYTYGADNEIRLRVRFILIPPDTGGAACPHEIEGCIYGPWGVWQSYIGGCYRYRTGTGYPPETVCPTDYQTKNPPCIDGCLPLGAWTTWVVMSYNPCWEQRQRTRGSCAPETQTKVCNACLPVGAWTTWVVMSYNPCWEQRQRTRGSCAPETQTKVCNHCLPLGAWSQWAHVSYNPCTEQRQRTRGSCAPETETRHCVCPWTQWTTWTLHTLNPCTQIRSRNGPPCPPGVHTETRPCIASCPPEPPGAVAAQGEGVLEDPAGPSRRKRDVPWCPEESWIIYGRTDGCMAVQNATWYKCIHEVCQDCIPPPGSGLICIPNKFTTLRMPLICPGGGSDVLTVTRPMACTCFQVRTTCDKFEGPCG